MSEVFASDTTLHHLLSILAELAPQHIGLLAESLLQWRQDSIAQSSSKRSKKGPVLQGWVTKRRERAEAKSVKRYVVISKSHIDFYIEKVLRVPCSAHH